MLGFLGVVSGVVGISICAETQRDEGRNMTRSGNANISSGASAGDYEEKRGP